MVSRLAETASSRPTTSTRATASNATTAGTATRSTLPRPATTRRPPPHPTRRTPPTQRPLARPPSGDIPNLIVGVVTTPAAVSDAAALDDIHAELARNNLLPGEHLLDSGYPSADQVVRSARVHGIRLVSPLLVDQSRQAKAKAGYDKAGFTFDFDHQHGTCPQGRASVTWNPCRQESRDAIVVSWAASDCGPCPARDLCTKGTRRQVTLRERALHEATVAARAEQETDQWKRTYAVRSGIEGTMHQTTHVTGIRTARYRGLPKTRLEHNFAATAINMIRLDHYWTGQPLDRTRTSQLARLTFALAA